MRRHICLTRLRSLAHEIRSILGRRASEAQLLTDLDRFANGYGLDLEQAKRAVMVLHGIPPGLTGPSAMKFTWQEELDTFEMTTMSSENAL